MPDHRTCTTCDGEGVQDCRVCERTRDPYCRRCMGRGEHACPTCEGSGVEWFSVIDAILERREAGDG
jgi:DnaJ-class molecular chaperone